MPPQFKEVDGKFFKERWRGTNREYVPDPLQRASLRLGFPPSYVVVGAYRLLSDKSLFVPIWQKCRSGVMRGVTVGGIWVGSRVCRGVTENNNPNHNSHF